MNAERTHDEHLLELMSAASKAEQTLAWKLSTLRHISRPKGVRFERDDRRSQDTIVDDVRALVEAGDAQLLSYMGTPSKFLAEYTDAAIVVADAYLAIRMHERSYTGWQRFYLVTSSAGLVHRDMNCSTCNKGRQATQFALLPTLSGQPVDALVEAFGPVLCSVCWPQAPVAWTDAERIPARIAQLLLDEGIEAFEAARAKLTAKRGGAKDALAAELATCRQMTVRGPQIKLAEKLVEEGVAAIVQRGGQTSWKGRWTPELIIKPVTS